MFEYAVKMSEICSYLQMNTQRFLIMSPNKTKQNKFMKHEEHVTECLKAVIAFHSVNTLWLHMDIFIGFLSTPILSILKDFLLICHCQDAEPLY